MTPPPPPASVDPPTPSTDPPRRAWTILGRLAEAVREQNWFAVTLEVCIVVLGVVIGFQINAWGQARSDLAREPTYLHQLAEDLRETERQLVQADSSVRGADRATGQLLLAYYLPERPDRDSVLAWLRAADLYSPVRPVMGTAEALVATGDLGLVQNDSLRSHITAYLNDTRKMMHLHDERVTRWLEHIDRLYTEVDIWATHFEPMSANARDSLARVNRVAFPDEESRRDPFPFVVEEFLTNRDMQYALWIATYTKVDMTSVRRRIRERSVLLREQVEAELDR